MKTIKNILIAATLLCVASVPSLSAQDAAQPQKHEFKVAVGDSVMIKRECQKYSTGEQPSVWVWDKVHTVRQLGTKRFPDGVLLMNIYSWICEDCLTNLTEHAKEEAPEPSKDQPDKVAAQVAPKDTIATTPVEPVVKDTVAQDTVAVVPQDTVSEPVKDTVVVVEQIKGDSIKSEQKFVHGYDRFTLGLRGGASALLHNVEQGKWLCGGDVILDLQYAHYWAKDGRPVDLGLIVGLGIGYSQSGMKTGVNTDSTYYDTSNSIPLHIDYKIHADEVNEQDGQLQLEVPLMFSLITEKGFFFNIGPKFMLPLYTPYTQKISKNENTDISAYFQETGVLVSNEVITGALAEDQYTTKATDNGNQFSINVMLGAELGWEWILKSGNSFGLGVYANYCVYNSFKNNTANKPLIEVTPPKGSEVAQVDVHSATKTYAKGLGYFDAGLKLAYHFNFPKKKKTQDSKLF